MDRFRIAQEKIDRINRLRPLAKGLYGFDTWSNPRSTIWEMLPEHIQKAYYVVAERVCQLRVDRVQPECEKREQVGVKEVVENRLLTDEERSTVIQRDTTLWCPTKGEFLDEVGLVIAKAQDTKTASILDREWRAKEKEYLKAIESARQSGYLSGKQARIKEAVAPTSSQKWWSGGG